jgi:hypothetical protein
VGLFVFLQVKHLDGSGLIIRRSEFESFPPHEGSVGQMAFRRIPFPERTRLPWCDQLSEIG